MRRQVWTSTPVESRRDVVTMHGVLGFGIDEVAELGLSFGVAAGDSHDVAGVFRHQIGIFIDKGLSHAGGVFFVDAKDNCLLETVATFLEKFGDLAGRQVWCGRR